MKKVKIMLKDKSKFIRSCAINIADQLNMHNDILHINLNEPNKENRKNAVMISEKIDDVIMISSKVFDIEPEVRTAALVKLKGLDLKQLDINIRREIFFLTLRDREEKVKNAAYEVVNKNIALIQLDEVIKLMDIEDLEIKQQKEFIDCLFSIIDKIEPEKITEMIQDTLLEKLLQSDKKVSDFILARVCIEVLKLKSESMLYNILPTTELISLIHYMHPTHPYLFTQSILQISSCLDVGNEEIRKTLVSILMDLCYKYELNLEGFTIEREYLLLLNKSFFASTSIEVYKQIIETLKSLLDQNPNEFSRIMSDIINEVREPLNDLQEDENIIVFIEDTQRNPSIIDKKNMLLKKLKRIDDEIEAYECEKENLIQKDQFAEALKVKNEVINKYKEAEITAKKLGDIEEILKANLARSLILTIEMLKGIKHGLMHLDILDLVKSLVNPSLEIPDENLQVLALECLTQCCLHKLEICCRYIYLFKKVLEKKNESFLEFTALKCLLDIYMI